MPAEWAGETGSIRHPENNNADSPADHYSDFPAPHPYSGHRAEIRYRADVPVRRRLDRGAEKVRGRRDASARHRSSGMDTIYSQRKKAVLRGNQHRQHPSYVELLTCLEMERHVKTERGGKMSKKCPKCRVHFGPTPR